MKKTHTSTLRVVKYTCNKVILAVWHSRGTSNCVYRIDTNLASIYPMQQKVKIKSVDIMSLKTWKIGSVKGSFSHYSTRSLTSRHKPLAIWLKKVLPDCQNQLLSWKSLYFTSEERSICLQLSQRWNYPKANIYSISWNRVCSKR